MRKLKRSIAKANMKELGIPFMTRSRVDGKTFFARNWKKFVRVQAIEEARNGKTRALDRLKKNGLRQSHRRGYPATISELVYEALAKV